MGTISHNNDSSTMQPVNSPVVLLIGIIADTTWRMFIPTIGLTILGVYIDNQLHSVPVATGVGVILGSIFALVLVRKQIRNGESR